MQEKEAALDEAIDETFPASDPPALKPDPPIKDNPEESRFERELEGGGLATVDYHREDGFIELVSTDVPSSAREKGIGTSIVMGVLDRLRAEKARVVASCSFVKKVVAEHPEYQDFVEIRAD